MTNALSGVFAPVITPFKTDLSPDLSLFAKHAGWLMGQGAGLAIFGTNSEANSLSLGEKILLMDKLLEHGLDPARMLPGTGACALPDTVALTRHAVDSGCAGVLMLPPFFYKNVSDDGLFAYYAEVIERVASPDLRLYLYHIPAFSGVPIRLPLIERLIRHYPEIVVGIKDSSGDWDNLETMLKAFPGFTIFPASESLLSRALPLGAAGCISATANIQPAAIGRLLASWKAPQAGAMQAQVDAVRQVFQQYPMIAALKFATAHYADNQTWDMVRPPLTSLVAQQKSQLLAELDAIGFAMAGLRD